jgi:integrase
MARRGRRRLGHDGDSSHLADACPPALPQHIIDAIANEVRARLVDQLSQNPADLNCASFPASPTPYGDGVVSEISIAAGKGSSTSTEEEPMYAWISHKPYKHHHKWRVWCGGLDGIKTHQTFDTESQAQEFIEKAKPKVLVGGGHPIGELVDKYIDEGTRGLRASSIKTMEFRLRTLARDRDRVPIEVFPWMKAWTQHAVTQSVDSQHGILSSARGFIDFCIKAGIIRRDPLIKVEISGHKKRGKKQLHIDESRRFIEEALKHPDDPLAVACAAMIYTGLRPGEIMGLQVRDLDAEGTILWVEKSKTEAGKRGVEVAEVFRPFLRAFAQGRGSQEFLFELKPERVRACKDARKSRRDALLRKTQALCEAAGLPVVCSHSMRGLHSTLAAGFGATGHAVAKALGHTSFAVTKRHYVDREVLENANLRSNLQVLAGPSSGNRHGN